MVNQQDLPGESGTEDRFITVCSAAPIAEAAAHIDAAYQAANGIEGILRVLDAADAESENADARHQIDGYTKGALLAAAGRLAAAIQVHLDQVANLKMRAV